jgi:hypothetical protein
VTKEPESTKASPEPPQTIPEMNTQAAEAVMRAYEDGLTRQAVRLRIDTEDNDAEMVYRSGIAIKWNATIGIAEDFSKRLMPEAPMKQLRTQVVNDESMTLLYRIAEDPTGDAGVLYMVQRDFMVGEEADKFFDTMGKRLVVIANTEDASGSWRVDNRGQDFNLVSNPQKAAEVCAMFNEQTYYYNRLILNQWNTLIFRSYPHPWQIWVENFEYKFVKIGEIPGKLKPGSDVITELMTEWEEENKISTPKKVGKVARDTQRMMNGQEPGPAPTSSS